MQTNLYYIVSIQQIESSLILNDTDSITFVKNFVDKNFLTRTKTYEPAYPALLSIASNIQNKPLNDTRNRTQLMPSGSHVRSFLPPSQRIYLQSVYFVKHETSVVMFQLK